MRGNWGCELEGGCVNIDVKCRACRGGADFRIVETYRIQTFNISISLYGLRGWLDKTASLFNSGGTNRLTSPPKNAKWYDNTHSAAVTVSTNKGGPLLGQDKEQGG